MKNCGKIKGFETKFAKSSNIFLHDNENFRSQWVNVKIKDYSKVSYAKGIFKLPLFCVKKFTGV